MMTSQEKLLPQAELLFTQRMRPYVMVDVGISASDNRPGSVVCQRRVDCLVGSTMRQVAGVDGPPVSNLHYVNLQQIAALEVSGQPMELVTTLGHPDAVFIFIVVHGACRLRTARGEVEINSGEFVVMRGDLTVRATHHEQFLVRGSRIPAAQLDRELPGWSAAELRPVSVLAGPGALILGLLDQLLSNGPYLTSRSADTYAQSMASVLADTLRHLLTATESPDTRAEHHRRRIRAYVRKHLADPALDAETIAVCVGVSVAHLYRLFASEPQSLFAWILSERLDACRSALGVDRRSVADVAFAWGFEHPEHFSRSFRRRYGCSPTEWRAQSRRAHDGMLSVTRQE